MTDLLQQMREDTLLDVPQEHVHTLLRHHPYALDSLKYSARQATSLATRCRPSRFQRFQQLVDKRFAQWRQV